MRFEIHSQKPHTKMIWLTCIHIILVVRMRTSPGPYVLPSEKICLLSVSQIQHNFCVCIYVCMTHLLIKGVPITLKWAVTTPSFTVNNKGDAIQETHRETAPSICIEQATLHRAYNSAFSTIIPDKSPLLYALRPLTSLSLHNKICRWHHKLCPFLVESQPTEMRCSSWQHGVRQTIYSWLPQELRTW